MKLITKFIDSLHAECIPQSTIDAIMLRVRGKSRSSDPAWDILTHELDDAIRAIASGKVRWRPNRAPIYTRYLDLLMGIRGQIEHVRSLKPSAALSQITTPNPGTDVPECGQHWSSWISDSDRAKVQRAFDKLYSAEQADKTARGGGRRITPFGTTTQLRTTALKWERLRMDAKAHVDTYTTSIEPGAYPRSSQEQTLLLERHRAASTAIRRITALQQEANQGSIINPRYMSPPRTWASPTLLHPDELAALRAAHRDAGRVGKLAAMVEAP